MHTYPHFTNKDTQRLRNNSFSYCWRGRLNGTQEANGTHTAPPESLNYLKEKIQNSEGCLKETGHHPVRNSEVAGRMKMWQSLIFFSPSFHQRKFHPAGAPSPPEHFLLLQKTSEPCPEWDSSFQREKVWFLSYWRHEESHQVKMLLDCLQLL